jgi:hypothetical protein
MATNTQFAGKQAFFKIIYPVAAFVGLYLAWRLITGAKNTANNVAAAIKGDANAAAIQDALNSHGINNVRTQAVQAVVDEIYNAFYKDSFFGWGEDEEKAVDQFNSLQNVNEAKAAAAIYRSAFKKSMYQDFIRFTFGVQRTRLKETLFQAIKNS